MDHRAHSRSAYPLAACGAGPLAVCLYLILGPFAEQTPSAVWGPADWEARIFVEPEESFRPAGRLHCRRSYGPRIRTNLPFSWTGSWCPAIRFPFRKQAHTS